MGKVDRGQFAKRITSFSERNQEVVNGYWNWLEAKVKSGELMASSVRSMKGTPVQIFEYSLQDIDYLTVSTLRNYLREKGKPNNINRHQYHIKDFLIYLDEVGLLGIDPDCLADEIIPRKKANEQARSATPLTLAQVVEIRKKIAYKPKLFFAFEVTYKYEMTLDELESFSLEIYDPNIKTILLKKRKVIVSDEIHDILMGHERYFDHVKTRNAYQDYFTKTGELIGIGLTWLDIKVTRERYFVRCSCCDQLYEPIPENLALLEFDEADKVYLVCRTCAARGGVTDGNGI